MKIQQCTHVIGNDTNVMILQSLPSSQHHTDHKQGGMTYTVVKARRIRQWLGLLQDKHVRSYQTPASKLEVFPIRYKATSKAISLVEELTYCRLEDENWIQVAQEVCRPLTWRTDYNTRLHTCSSFSSMPCTMPAATGHLLATAMPEKPQ